MKLKKYTINEQGEVEQASPFGYDEIIVTAKNKTEATKKMLQRLQAQNKFGIPRVFAKNNSLALIWHNGDHIMCATGNHTLYDTGEQGWLSYGGGQENVEETLAKSDFDYYSSEEYQQRKKDFS